MVVPLSNSLNFLIRFTLAYSESVYPVGGQELVKNVWFPQMIKEGIKILALVVSHNIFAKMSIHETRSPHGNLIINYFNDEGDALAWLVSQRL